MSAFMTIMGGGILALLLAGYYGQKYLPPPAPKIFGIDLGTTFSCIGAFHPGSGHVSIIKNEEGQQCIPSVVAYLENGTILIGYAATKQADQNPENTFFDAKRFIGKRFSKEDFDTEVNRYPFKLELRDDGFVMFKCKRVVGGYLMPEQIGAEILMTLKKTAERHFMASIAKVVMSVPAEFDETQRAHTVIAGKTAELKVMRLINEPTAAALAYGLNNKTGVQDVLVVDLGGGTLDVSLLDIQGGMFLTRAMAGNNRLGGQDFNERLRSHITALLENYISKSQVHLNNTLTLSQLNSNHKITDPDDIQLLRNAVENIKIALTFNETVYTKFRLVGEKGTKHVFDHLYAYYIYSPITYMKHIDDDNINLNLRKDGKHDMVKNTKEEIDKKSKMNFIHNSPENFSHIKENFITISVDRTTFNSLNYDLFLSILEPINRVIEEAEISPSDVEEIVLVGGSTRIPRVREIISEFFGGRGIKTDVDPEVAVAMGVSLQAGIMGGSWPLSVSALEVPYSAAKKQLL